MFPIKEFSWLLLTKHYLLIKKVNFKAAITEMYRWIPWEPLIKCIVKCNATLMRPFIGYDSFVLRHQSPMITIPQLNSSSKLLLG